MRDNMKFKDLFPYSFKSLRKEFNIPGPSELSLVDQCRADDSELCIEMMTEPYSLTEAQMHHAADRYLLGKSHSGKTIYWMIDELGIVLDGHIGTSWVSTMFKNRLPEVAPYIVTRHCLFGQHLLTQADPSMPISIVESERSAVILSELYPQSLWLAYAYPANFSERLLEPLQGHRVVLFSNADETMDNYLSFLEIADQARRRYHLDVTVSTLLEDRTTLSQKSRHIDLLTFYLESIKNKATIQ